LLQARRFSLNPARRLEGSDAVLLEAAQEHLVCFKCAGAIAEVQSCSFDLLSADCGR